MKFTAGKFRKARFTAAALLIFCVAFFHASADEKVSRPGEYSGFSEPRHAGAIKRSVYVPMRDGVELAVDYKLPLGLSKSEKIPAILVQTRYWRDMVINVRADKAHDFLARHGYAVVVVDVRGTGASFGTWPYPWSEDEIKDGGEIVDWILAQPWSNGVVGTYGTSYTATSGEFLLVNRHPAVKAAALRYGLFDSYTDIAYPGGIHHAWFLDTWNRADQALDANDAGALLQMMGVNARLKGIPGVTPVGPPIKRLVTLKSAVASHRQNGDVFEESKKYECRDDYSDNWGGTVAIISPYYYKEDIESSGAAIYSYSGWFDGPYTNAAINRHLNFKNSVKLILGPWPHGGKEQISPWAESQEVKFGHDEELLRFFDYYLKGIDNGIADEPSVYYYTMGEEKWKAADSWPPEARRERFYFGPGHSLSPEVPGPGEAFDVYKVDYSAGSGVSSRYNSLINLEGVSIGYPDRAEADKKLLVYDSGPLLEDVEVTGHPVVKLYVSSTAEDGHFFVYLEDVAPDGTVSYITEGLLRGIFREVSEEEPLYKLPAGVPYHTFRRDDAAPMVPNQIEMLTFDLQATSVLFKRGHRIRVALAGADRDHFVLPKGPEPTLEVHRSASYSSYIELPVVD